MTFETLKKINELLKADVEKQKNLFERTVDHVNTWRDALEAAESEEKPDVENIEKIKSEIEGWMKIRKSRNYELQRSEYALDDFLQHDWR